jgi:hypothetical protein
LLLSLASNDIDITTACFYEVKSIGPRFLLRERFGKPMHNDIKCEFADEKPVKPPVAVCIKRKLTAADNIGILLFAIPEAQRLLTTLAEVR